ncbi:hypothetical protein ACFQ0O_27650 [Saccharopolyspora spinosporotrichia]
MREQHRRRRRLGRRVEREIDLDPLVAPGPVDDVEQGLARRCRLGNRRPPFAAGEQEDTEPEKGDKDHCRKDEALAAPGVGDTKPTLGEDSGTSSIQTRAKTKTL